MPAPRVLKLRGDQERRRFFVGAAVDVRCTQVTATMIAATGRGLESRFEVASSAVTTIQPCVTALFEQLSSGVARHPTDVMLLASQLAEIEAEALDRLAAIEHEAWQRVLLCGVVDAGLWQLDDGLPRYLSLCDAARLADVGGLNVVDAFPARDVAQDGRGRPLDVVPLWLLLHDTFKNRAVVSFGPRTKLTYLPASRDESGANAIWRYEAEGVVGSFDALRRNLPAHLPIDEILLAEPYKPFGIGSLPPVLTHATNVLEAASAAVLAMLYIDQISASLPHLTGANAPRVLGRLTPGNTAAWHRLLRDLAFARPLVTPLRTAI
jgi:1,6-anhydro-N-acetylmuramate kinase